MSMSIEPAIRTAAFHTSSSLSSSSSSEAPSIALSSSRIAGLAAAGASRMSSPTHTSSSLSSSSSSEAPSIALSSSRIAGLAAAGASRMSSPTHSSSSLSSSSSSAAAGASKTAKQISLWHRACSAYRCSRLVLDHRVVLDHLEKDKEPLAQISHKKLSSYYQKLGPVIKRSLGNPDLASKVSTALTSLLNTRIDYQSQLRPVCTSLPGSGHLFPQYRMISSEDLHTITPDYAYVLKDAYIRLENGLLYLTKEMDAAFKSSLPKQIRTKDELDVFVQALSNTKDFIPWDNRAGGCHTCALLCSDLFRLCGMPREAISIQYVKIPDPLNKYGWSYHYAPMLHLADGTSWIVDPTLETSAALSLSDWIKQQKKDPESEMEVVNAGLLETSSLQETLQKISLTPAQCFTYSKPLEAPDDDDYNGLINLGRYRSELEQEWLRMALV